MARSGAARPHRRLTRRRILLGVGVVIFVIVDILLIAAIVTRDDGATSGRVPGPIPTFRTAPSPTPTPSPTPDAPAVVSAPRFMVAVSENDLWRATNGSCTGTASVIERSLDGGQTWALVNTPGIDVKQVLQLEPQGEATTWLVARSGADCAVGAFASYTDGEFWGAYPGEVGDFVYIDPALTIDGLPVLAPCEPVTQVQSVGTIVVAGCADVLAERVTETGEWASLVVPGLLASTPSDAGYTLAVWGVAGCSGISIQSATLPLGTAAPAMVGCIADEAEPVHATLAQFGESVWLWSGDRVRFSGDSGATWG